MTHRECLCEEQPHGSQSEHRRAGVSRLTRKKGPKEKARRGNGCSVILRICSDAEFKSGRRVREKSRAVLKLNAHFTRPVPPYLLHDSSAEQFGRPSGLILELILLV